MLDANDDFIIAWGREVSEQHRKAEDHDGKFVSNFKHHFGSTHPANAPDEEKNAEEYAKLFLQKLAEFTQRHFNVQILDSDDITEDLFFRRNSFIDRSRVPRRELAERKMPLKTPLLRLQLFLHLSWVLLRL